MVSKTAKNLFALAALMLLFTSVAAAQQGSVRGKVTGKGEGGEKIVEGAIIDIYRIDLAQKFQTKSDKKGEYFHSLPAFGTYAVAISAGGYAPIYSDKFKIVSDQPIEQNFELAPGDGRRFTLEEIKSGAKEVSASGPSKEELKKQQEEAEKNEAERERITKENEKIKANFGEMKKHFDAGLALNGKQDYDGAINEFKQAIAFDDAQPTIYANLALALFNLGATKFNAKLKEDARQLFIQSAEYGEKAIKMNPQSAEFQKIFGDACDILFKNFGAGDYADKAIKAYTDGSSVEQDPAKKSLMTNRIGSIYFNMGDVEKSMQTYEKVLAADANNLEALSGKALVLAASGEKPKMEQAIGLFQQVAEKAPANSRLKNDAESSIKYLADTLKIEVGPAKDDKKGKKKK